MQVPRGLVQSGQTAMIMTNQIISQIFCLAFALPRNMTKEPSPSAFARQRLPSCSWQNSRREILSAKSPSLSSTVMWSAEGNRASNTLIGADGLYNGRSVSRQNQPRIKDSVEKWRVCASAIYSLPLNQAILRFMVKGIGRRECAALFLAGLFTIRNGARWKRGRACAELKTVRPGGRDTRTLFRG